MMTNLKLFFWAVIGIFMGCVSPKSEPAMLNQDAPQAETKVVTPQGGVVKESKIGRTMESTHKACPPKNGEAASKGKDLSDPSDPQVIVGVQTNGPPVFSEYGCQ